MPGQTATAERAGRRGGLAEGGPRAAGAQRRGLDLGLAVSADQGGDEQRPLLTFGLRGCTDITDHLSQVR
ncbi:hypothetical protein [Pseudonocardia xishanensis]|uniref:hypothetical protein n=1 Tax=Pseudonocardia xishanensis TaxID=630995 RepID=UPI0031EEA394